MFEVCEDFCPLVHRMLNLVPDGEVCEWKLRTSPAACRRGRLGAMRCSAMPATPDAPAHGARERPAMIEDGAVLAGVREPNPTRKTGDPEYIAKVLQVFEKLRKPHTTALVDLAAFSGRTLHSGGGKGLGGARSPVRR